MPYAVTDTISVPADCSAGVALAGLSYFAVWPQTPRDVSRRGVHLHNSGRSGVQLIYPWTHGTFRLRHGLRDGLRENEFELPVSVLS